MVERAVTAADVLFAAGMFAMFTVLLVGILVVMHRLSRHDKRMKLGLCPKCGGNDIDHRPYLRDGETAKDSRHVAWFCNACKRVVHIGVHKT